MVYTDILHSVEVWEEENRAVRGSGGTGSVCRVVRLEPSHSGISTGDSLSLSLVVCRQPVIQSKKLRAELTTLLPPARRNTRKRENWGNFWTAGEKYRRILFVLIFSLDLESPDLSWCLRIYSPFQETLNGRKSVCLSWLIFASDCVSVSQASGTLPSAVSGAPPPAPVALWVAPSAPSGLTGTARSRGRSRDTPGCTVTARRQPYAPMLLHLPST